jgi:hypothetical protein
LARPFFETLREGCTRASWHRDIRLII